MHKVSTKTKCIYLKCMHNLLMHGCILLSIKTNHTEVPCGARGCGGIIWSPPSYIKNSFPVMVLKKEETLSQ